MFEDLERKLIEKIGRDSCEWCLREYQYNVQCINQNWTDEFGQDIYKAYQSTESELLSLEKRRTRLALGYEDVVKRLQKIVDETEADTGKGATKGYPYLTDNSSLYGSGGPKRRK